MYIEVLKSKLHCVKVTEANLNYMGSITIDEDLMDAAGLIAGEKVEVVNNNNGYSLRRPRHSSLRWCSPRKETNYNLYIIVKERVL